MHIVNLNSKFKPNSTIFWQDMEEHVLSRVGFLIDKWAETPVYLTDKRLMDELYPPEKRRTLRVECSREILFRENRGDSDSRELRNDYWKELKECEAEIGKGCFVAMGLYKKSVSVSDLQIIRNYANRDIGTEPSIFICPERVEDWSGGPVHSLDTYRRFRILFSQVLYHELTHAFVKSNHKFPHWAKLIRGTLWAKIIEETLCNAMAFRMFTRSDEKSLIRLAILGQPVEYRGYSYWLELPTKHEVKKFLKEWKGFWNRNSEYDKEFWASQALDILREAVG